MKRSFPVYARGLVLLLAVLSLAGVPAWAQQQVGLSSVKPNSARAGEEVDLEIQGWGFCSPAQVNIGEFQSSDVRVNSDTSISARVFIPEGAQSGSHDVVVTVDCGGPEETFSDVLPGGFTVLESPSEPTSEPRPGEPTSEPGRRTDPRPPDPIDWWLVLLIVAVVGVIVVGGVLLTVTLAVRARRAVGSQAGAGTW